MQTMKFSGRDKEILRVGLSVLPFWERHILVLRFWENYSIKEIAKALEMEWDEVDKSIEESQQKLKKFCLSFPEFSRAESHASEAYQQEEQEHENFELSNDANRSYPFCCMQQ